MESSHFTLKIVHNGTELKASCNKFQVAKCPQIYVVVKADKRNSLVHTFYEVNGPGKELFWFDHYDGKEMMRKAIAKALERKTKTLLS